MNAKFIKGLLMTIVSVVVTALSTEPVIWTLVAINCVGTALVYTGKNAWFQSNSTEGSLTWRDGLSAIILAVGNTIVAGASSLIVEGIIDWKSLLKLVAGVVAAYLTSTVFTGKPTETVKQ